MTAPHHRREERRELKALLTNGASILMLAPRRIGKTWLLKKIEMDMKEEEWLCIRIDVEGKQTEEEFLRVLCDEIQTSQNVKTQVISHIKQRFKQVLIEGIDTDLSQAIGKLDSRVFLTTLIESLNEQPAKTLILIDEIALFIHIRAQEDPDGTRALLYHLRNLQQEYTNVIWLLTGSVGLDVVARRHAMQGAILDFDPFPLEPFNEPAARSYIDDLCTKELQHRPFKFGEGAFEHLVQELGWLSPYYLRQLAIQIYPAESSRTDGCLVASVEDVSRAFEKLLSSPFRTRFAAWEEHIAKNFPKEDEQHLRDILATACEAVDGEQEATYLTRLNASGLQMTPRKLRELLNALGNDGYLVKNDNRWKFSSGLLRRYWKEHMS